MYSEKLEPDQRGSNPVHMHDGSNESPYITLKAINVDVRYHSTETVKCKTIYPGHPPPPHNPPS